MNIIDVLSNEDILALMDIVSGPFRNSRPFKPYSSIGEYVEGIGQMLFFSSGLFIFSIVATGASCVLFGGAALILTISPIMAVSLSLFTAGNTKRKEGENLLKHVLNSVKNGVFSGLALFANALVAATLIVILSGIALSVSAFLAASSVATAVIGSSVQTTRLIGTAGSGVKKGIQSSLSLFSACSHGSQCTNTPSLPLNCT